MNLDLKGLVPPPRPHENTCAKEPALMLSMSSPVQIRREKYVLSLGMEVPPMGQDAAVLLVGGEDQGYTAVHKGTRGQLQSPI